jgi:cysteine desulfurase
MTSNLPLYLDYNATAPLLPQVMQAMTDAMHLIGNPSSIHTQGRMVRKHIEQARAQIAQTVHCDPTHITFTSGATEANNWAVFGSNAKRILMSSIEHASLIDLPVEKIIIPVTTQGVVDIDALEKLLAQDNTPTLVCVMWVNNETGVIQPIEQIAALCAIYSAQLHVDAVQALGRFPIDLSAIPITSLSLSAHKIGGPSGVGALVYAHDVVLEKMIHGGGQERRRRAGTENFLGIVGFGVAAQIAQTTPADYQQLGKMRDALEEKLLSVLPDVKIAGQGAPRVGNTTQLIWPHQSAEQQLIALDLAGIAISSGSACSSGSIQPSHVLRAMGVSDALARCAIRVSTGPTTTQNDIDRFFSAWVANSQRSISR